MRRSRRHTDPGQCLVGVRPGSCSRPGSTCFLLPFWLLRGRARSSTNLPLASSLIPAHLNIDSKFSISSSRRKSAGRRIALVTAADSQLARGGLPPISAFFDEVHASDGEVNLKGAAKQRF